jgi:hypothetical protein
MQGYVDMHDTLSSLVERALVGNSRPLEFYLREHSRLPGPRANLELANDLSDLLAAAIPRYPDSVHSLISYFANGNRKMVDSNTPSEFITMCGVLAYGVCATARPDWYEETFKLLCHYACSPYWRVRESVTVAFQHLLSVDPGNALPQLDLLVQSENYLQQRAAITIIAEPRLLYSSDMLARALALQRLVLENIHNAPQSIRKNEDFRVLRRALGYTLSVVTAAAPEEGFALMRECASWNDADVTWVLRENLKKKRLAKFVRDTAALTQLLA